MKVENTESKYSLFVWKATTKQFQRVATIFSERVLLYRMVVMVGAALKCNPSMHAPFLMM